MSAQDVVVTHNFKAPAERVYDGFLDARTAGQFMFSTPAGRIVRAESDARMAGAFLYSDLRDGEEVLHTGRYVELEPARRIVIAFSVPKYSSEENTVEIGIVPDGTGCAVTLSHREVPAQWLDGTRGTWAAILAKADSVIG